jgi:hypothetical protein
MINNQHLETVHTIKLLGVYLTSDLKWIKHVTHICSKASKRLYALRLLKRKYVMAYNQAIFEGFFAVSFGLSLNTRGRCGTLLYRIHSATKSNISRNVL